MATEGGAGLERERRLQRCRVAFREPSFREQLRSPAAAWPEELAAEFEWLDDLARAGHWGAIRLRDRIRASSYHAKGVQQLAPTIQERLAARLPKAAEGRALAECRSESPDMAALARWLDAAGHGPLAGELREARELAGTLTAGDLEAVVGFIRSFTAGEALHRLGRMRLEAGEPGRQAAAALLKAAAQKGYVPAVKDLLAQAVERAHANGSLPDWEALMSWLEKGGREHTSEEMREAQRIAGALGARDLERIEAAVRADAAAGDLLAVLAGDRFRAGDPASVTAANAMLERAARRGSPKALAVLWERDWPRAIDQRAFIEDWALRGPPPENARADCLRIALAMDRGEHPRPATPDQIARFYSWAGHPGPPLAHNAPLTGYRSYLQAQQLDPRRGDGGERDAALARRWYERGIDLGDDQCLEAWLIACVLGQLGMASDPSAARAQLEHWKACGGSLAKSGWRLLGGARVMLGHARMTLRVDPGSAHAAEWLQLAADLGLADARESLPEA